MSLGVLRNVQHPHFEVLERAFAKRLQTLASARWPLIQGGTNQEALDLWKSIWVTLELTRG